MLGNVGAVNLIMLSYVQNICCDFFFFFKIWLVGFCVEILEFDPFSVKCLYESNTGIDFL